MKKETPILQDVEFERDTTRNGAASPKFAKHNKVLRIAYAIVGLLVAGIILNIIF